MQEQKESLELIKPVFYRGRLTGLIIHGLIFSKIEIVSNTPTTHNHNKNVENLVGDMAIRDVLLKVYSPE